MFNKKIKCQCGSKISKNYSFCPFCGRDLRFEQKEKEPDNLLDAIDELQMPSIFHFPFKKLVNEIEKQMIELDKELGKEMKKTNAKPSGFAHGISISINSTNGVPVIKVKQFGPDGIKEITNKGNEKQILKNAERTKIKTLTKAEQEKLERFAKLPRYEPETTVRRLSDRIIYKILLPGIKDSQNIIINKLQNSIEIKAFTKDRAYFKLIPLALPIKRHYLEDEKLILELNPKI